MGAGNPWGCHVVLTMGYLTAMLITVPMGYFNLDDNMIVQVVSFILTVGCWGMWLVACFFSDAFATPSGWYLPAVNTGNAWSSQVGEAAAQQLTRVDECCRKSCCHRLSSIPRTGRCDWHGALQLCACDDHPKLGQ